MRLSRGILLSLVLASPAAALHAGENVAVSQLADAGDADIAYNPPISHAGAARDAVAPAIAWSHGDNAMFLMVWAQDGEIWGQVQSEIHGGDGIRRDDFKISSTAGAANPAVAYAGALLGGDDVRVSGMGGTGDPRFHADDPAVAYGTTAGSFISAWEGDDQTDDVFHVFAGSTFGADEPAPRPRRR